LIHGLAFAATLNELGLGRWERVSGLLAFNLGIETMQLVVVAAVLPSLVLLSRTSRYSVLRIGGAVFACFTSAGWIVERLLNVHNHFGPVVGSVGDGAIWIGSALFVVSLVCWWLHEPKDEPPNATSAHTTAFNVLVRKDWSHKQRLETNHFGCQCTPTSMDLPK
jgi:hypothetical protein